MLPVRKGKYLIIRIKVALHRYHIASTTMSLVNVLTALQATPCL
jgi:hypothetical protein